MIRSVSPTWGRSLAAATLLAAPLFASAQSADARSLLDKPRSQCGTFKQTAERAICRSRRLVRLDSKLTELYGQLRATLTRGDFRDLRTEQRAWLRTRNACGAKGRCLARTYIERIEILRALALSEDPSGDSVSVDGQRGFVWSTDSYRDEQNNNRRTVLLTHGKPETDAVSMQAVCMERRGEDFARVLLSADVARLREGQDVRVLLSVDNEYSQTFVGEVFGKNREVGITGVVIRPQGDDAVWEALARGSALKYRVGRRPTQAISLRGSFKAVRKFTDTCTTILNATTFSSADEDTDLTRRLDDDGGQRVAANDDLRSPRSGGNGAGLCRKQGTLRSENSKTPVTITFKNDSPEYRAVMWLDFNGRPINYADLEPGQTYTVKTFETHPWMFTDGPGNCIEIMLPRRGQGRYSIAARSPGFGPE